MKQMLALAVIVLSVVILYRVYQDRLRDEALRSRVVVAATPRPPGPPPQILVSRKLENTYVDLLGGVDANLPADLVPPIHLIKERLMDKQTSSTGAKRAIYEKAVQLTTAMEATAEERTRTLEAIVNHSARGRGTLDSAQGSTTGAFFAQGAKTRWDTEVRRRKPGLDQLFTALRSQEREWNKTADARLAPEDFDAPNIPPPTITSDPAASAANPLERGAYDTRRVFPWRRQYYDQNGVRYR